MHVLDAGAGVPAVPVAHPEAVVGQLVVTHHRRQNPPEVPLGVGVQAGQVGRVLAGNQQQVQPGARVREVVPQRRPVPGAEHDPLRRVAGQPVRAEQADPGGLETAHLRDLVRRAGILKAVERHGRARR